MYHVTAKALADQWVKFGSRAIRQSQFFASSYEQHNPLFIILLVFI
jgi:hypothetical protein